MSRSFLAFCRIVWIPLVWGVTLRTSTASIDTSQWTNIGPDGGGVVQHVQFDDGSVLASIFDLGLFRSVDGGASWLMISSMAVSDLVRVPGSSTVYAAGEGVLRSDNDGVDWRPLNAGLTDPATGPTGPTYPGLAVADLELDPASPLTIYAGTLAGLYRTTDGGETGWTPISVSSHITAVELDPGSPNTIYVGTGLGTIRKSSDGGNSWITVANPGSSLTALVILPSGTLYAAFFGAGVWRSEDRGATWIVSNAGLDSRYVDTFAVGGSIHPVLYASTLPPEDPSRGKVFRSLDGGATWTAANDGLPGKRILSLAADPLSGLVVYAGTSGAGVYRSTNGGGLWEPVNRRLSAFTVNELLFDRSNPDLLYAGTSGGGLFRSLDSGGSWDALPSPEYILALQIDPGLSSTLYAGTATGVSRSTDGGMTWTSSPAGTPAGSVTSLALDPANRGTLYAASSGFGVFRSLDGGDTWSPASSGLTDLRVVALTVSAGNPSSVFAAVFGAGVFRSLDSGQSWVLVLEEPYASEVTADARFPGTVYAGGSGSIYKTADNGTTWSRSGRRLMDGVTAIAFDPKSTDRIYAATHSGVFRSANGGMSWTRIDAGLTETIFRSVAVHPDEDRIYVGTFFKSVFTKSDPDPERPSPTFPKSLPFRP